MPDVSIRIFGGIAVDGRDGPVSIGGPRQRRLLALLAARAGTVVSIDWLAEHLWDDADRPDATTPAIRTYLSRLRQSLPPEGQGWVETAPSGYVLSAPAAAVEHLRFALLRSAATRAREDEDPQRALDLLDEALALWRGDPFRELEDVDWAWAEVEQLRLERLEMREERWEASLALGRHTQITGELAAFTSEHGERDRAVRQYALALHRSGRTPAALRSIAEHRRLLADQSGFDPSPAMVQLEQQLLTGDSRLEVEKVGRPLRGYRLLEEAGVGAFSIVWRGIQPSVEREVAVKQIRAELASQPEFIRRFEAEAHLVARLEHPHIVPLIDYWRDPDSAYLVMRWLRGGTLERRLDDGPLTLEQTRALARQIGGALSTAHAHGVIHRDVKTANILFDEQGHAFLGDFGIALDVAESAGPEAKLSPGSPFYAAPEQLRGQRLSAEADVFSLGVVLYECLRGSLPFPAPASAEEALERQLQDDFPSLRDSVVDLPASVSEGIARATAKDPADRFASIDEFVAALGDSPSQTTAHVSESAIRPIGDVENPYVGLRAFDDADTARFFGRSRLVSQVVERLEGTDVASRCVVIVGPSGSGKSSIARAGVIPALRAGAVSGSADWFFTSMVPGPDPFESLESALLRVAVNPPDSLVGQLRDGPRGILRSIRRCLADDGQRLTLLIDQFEEVFTADDADLANAFLEALAIAVQEPATPLRLVATLRADYYHRPLEHVAFAPVLAETVVDVAPLAADEMEQAISEPARSVGVSFEPGLVARLSAEAAGQPSPLPLLQYTLSELFDRRAAGGSSLTIADYETLGGLSGALAARAESIHRSGTDDQRVATRRVFGQLASPIATSADLRRRVRRVDLGDDQSTEWVLTEFGAARLLTFDREEASREPTVEVAHEALLREWPRLVGWLDEDRDLLRTVDAIATAADTWDEGGRQDADLSRGGRLETANSVVLASPERFRPVDIEFVDASQAVAQADAEADQRKVVRLRRLVIGIAAALVVALVAGTIAIREQRRASDEARTAEAATADAELATLMSRSSAEAANNPAASLLLALEANRRSPGRETEQAVLNALGTSVVAAPVRSNPPITSEDCEFSLFDAAGLYEFAVSDGQLVRRDLATGEVTRHGQAPASCAAWVGDEIVGRQFVGREDATSMTLGPFAGAADVEVDFEHPTQVAHLRFLPTGNLVMFVFHPDGGEVRLIDWSTGEWVGEPWSGGEYVNAGASEDGRLIATSFAHTAGLGGVVLITDGTSGALLHTVETAAPAISLAFDETNGELLAGLDDGQLVTIDVESGEPVAEVPTSAVGLLAVGSREDGMVIALTPGLVEVVDRRTGPTGESSRLRNVARGAIREDGLIVAVHDDGSSDVVTIDGSALVAAVYPIDVKAQVGFRDGSASVSDLQGNVDIVDLDSGEQTSQQLEIDGEPLVPLAVVPDAEGFWTVDASGLVTLWVDGVPAATVEIGEAFTGAVAGEWWANLTGEPGGAARAHLIRMDPTDPRIVLSVDAPGGIAVHPAGDGGLHVLGNDGFLRTFGADGALLHEVETGTEGVLAIAGDVSSGRLAIVDAQNGGVTVVDTESGAVDRIAESDSAINVGLARGGEFLVVTGVDGTVRLWDLERMEPAAFLWEGTGAPLGQPSGYDEETDSIWVSTSGQILQIPLDPETWIDRACEAAGRELTEEEWERFVPGDRAQQSACA